LGGKPFHIAGAEYENAIYQSLYMMTVDKKYEINFQSVDMSRNAIDFKLINDNSVLLPPCSTS